MVGEPLPRHTPCMRRLITCFVILTLSSAVTPATALGAEATAPADPGACPGSAPSVPRTILFAADDGIHGTELWATDGTAEGTRLVADIHPEGSSAPQLIGTLDGVLYFFADDGIHGREPWRSDGTAEGTRLLADLRASKKAQLTGSADLARRGRQALLLGTHRGRGQARAVVDGRHDRWDATSTHQRS